MTQLTAPRTSRRALCAAAAFAFLLAGTMLPGHAQAQVVAVR